ncbi:uncharacterized protein LOC116003843 [Ipomoea triloba]|uniref:uncharacterized protein LOC116003843 n=1 Tax=Ipomoea triloba TaxID=35885 RepID=UPI00125DC333|nr:uncharacterized protein LOC116003843 [Ipomoea triloba]
MASSSYSFPTPMKVKKRAFICSCWSSVFLLSAGFFIATAAFILTDYRQRFLGWQLIEAVRTSEPTCQDECKPVGTETLPRGIVSKTSDLEMRPLWGSAKQKPKSPMSLLALAVGIKQKKNVDEIVKKFPLSDFMIMLFHYDGLVDEWKDLKWSSSAIHVSAPHQTKWWFAKRFLHPDIVADYAYIFLWDEDLGVQHFNVARYLSIVKEEGLQISQPAIDAEKSEVHHKLTARENGSKVHRREININGPGRRCFPDSQGPPCTGWVEMMAPVFSSASWRCVWHIIQNDLVHGWGVDFQVGYCAQGNRTANVGVVDTEYLVHYALPTLGGSSNETSNEAKGQGSSKESSSHQSDGRNAVRKQSYAELEIFKNRWSKAVREDKCWVDPF